MEEPGVCLCRITTVRMECMVRLFGMVEVVSAVLNLLSRW